MRQEFYTPQGRGVVQWKYLQGSKYMYRMTPKLFTTHNKQCGFTLLETLMYIALLSILMLSTLVTAWQLLESMHADSVHIAAQEEASFVLKKIEKILQSAESISQPSDTHASTTTLMLYTKDSDLVTVRLNNASSSIEIRRKDTLFLFR